MSWPSAQWPAPAKVKTLLTTRAGGLSEGRFARYNRPGGGFNVGLHSGDQRETVIANRALLRRQLPADPNWLHQVHGIEVLEAIAAPALDEREGDALVAHMPLAICAIQSADCMAVLLCDRAGTVVAAAHAGWRGLAAGVLEATVAKMHVAPANLLAFLGPSIGPQAFEVGEDVYQTFMHRDPAAAAAFVRAGAGKWLASLPTLAIQRLNGAGVTSIHGGGHCTVSEPETYYSHRRDAPTGRMAALIWIDA